MKLWSNVHHTKAMLLITEACPMKVKITIQGRSSNGDVWCPLDNFKTFKDFFLNLCTNIKHH